MAIRLEQPGLAGLYAVAQQIGKAEQEAKAAAVVAAQKAQRKQEIALEKQMRALDQQLELEKFERAKRWEIDKMELASRMDFEREERLRQRKLDNIDSALQQVDKEVQAGRITEQEAQPIRLRLELSKHTAVPTGLIPRPEGARYGVEPWWRKLKNFPVGSPEHNLYLAYEKKATTGVQTGTVPYYLSPEWLQTNRNVALQVLESRGIVLTDEELDEYIKAGLGQPVESEGGKFGGYGVTGTWEEPTMPEPKSKVEYDNLPKGTRYKAPDGSIRIK